MSQNTLAASLQPAPPGRGIHAIGGEEGGPGLSAVGDPGFNLRPDDLHFSTSVEPYFNALVQGAMGGNGEVQLQEAYLESRTSPGGWQLKVGRFRSDLGYPHRKHPGQWGYSQGHVPYWFLKKPFYLRDTGIQLTWKPGTDYHARIGVEAFQGDEELLTRFDGASVLKGAGLGEELVDRHGEPKDGPRLFTAFAEVAPDIGAKQELQGSVYGVFSTDHQELNYDPSTELLKGDYWMAGTNWAYGLSNPTPFGKGKLKLTAEYLYSVKDLDVAYHGEDPAQVGTEEEGSQEGYYLQARYGFEPNLKADVRLEVVGLVSGKGQESMAGSETWSSSSHIAAQGTWSPTEHSSLRVRWSLSDIEQGSYENSSNRVFLQYNMDLGHHQGGFL
ncbi:hypothetical protein [Thiohalorhabdus methylotrophus]|uniref:Capsule assembly protein Wzi n=1 Tax=Thiohalorhabdus methylotrophus TaxID=3242694 RepID=A0ABV4TVU5_9GAMM